MIDKKNYIGKEYREELIRKIKNLEAMLIDDKLGATTKNGKNNYEFMLMMYETRKLLNTTKSLGEDEDFTNMNNNDLTIGDMQ